jgi:hypothetical protein
MDTIPTSDAEPSMTDQIECICGADIWKITSGASEIMWVNSRGSLYCYPDEPGADGEATHEPYEE